MSEKLPGEFRLMHLGPDELGPPITGGVRARALSGAQLDRLMGSLGAEVYSYDQRRGVDGGARKVSTWNAMEAVWSAGNATFVLSGADALAVFGRARETPHSRPRPFLFVSPQAGARSAELRELAAAATLKN